MTCKKLFDFTTLLQYKESNKNFDLNKNLDLIKNENIKKMIKNMLSLNPFERLSVKEIF